MSTEGGYMLINLHVRNLALIKEADVDFSKGLIVLQVKREPESHYF